MCYIRVTLGFHLDLMMLFHFHYFVNGDRDTLPTYEILVC